MQIILFEDPYIKRFRPLIYLRAFFDLRVGMMSFIERVKERLGHISGVWIREYLKDVYKERMGKIKVNEVMTDEDALLINSRLLLSDKVAHTIREKIENKESLMIMASRYPLVIKVKRNLIEDLKESYHAKSYDEFVKKCEETGNKLTLESATITNNLWELIKLNSELIRQDFSRYRGQEWEGEVDERVVIHGDKNEVFISKGAKVEALSILDAREGPIFIGENTKISSGAFIQGPAYIGRESLIVTHALIREGSNIGDVCRIGGEVEESIIQGYSNKYHTGFLGHAYVGEWVNLGALTTNSDLKNTYGTIKMSINGERIDTGLTKLGTFIGDMVKTGIGTLIFAGKKIGISSHIYGLVHEDVPSFTIYAKSMGLEPIEMYVDSAIETQRRMMSRRGKKLTKHEEELIRNIFKMTSKEREEAGVKKGRFVIR